MSTPPGVRRLLLDAAPGERRGVVLLDGLPERLLIERDGEVEAAPLGARFAGRVTATAGDRAFVALPHGPDGVMRPPEGGPPQGALVEVEVVAEAHAEKGPRLALRGGADGRPRLLAPPPSLAARLRAFAPGSEVEHGDAAREAADEAQEAALAVTHRFRRGLTLHVEPTRALTAVDVDLAQTSAHREARVRDTNLSALRHAVRLVRLKSLGGVVVIDLAGLPSSDTRGLYRAEVERALAPDGEGASASGPDRLGLVTLVRPWRERPVADRLLGADGGPRPRTVAQRLVRELQREAAAEPGSRWVAVATPEVAAALAPLLPALGPRFAVRTLAAGEGQPHILRL